MQNKLSSYRSHRKENIRDRTEDINVFTYSVVNVHLHDFLSVSALHCGSLHVEKSLEGYFK